MENEGASPGEPADMAEQVQRVAREDEPVDQFDADDAEWYAVLGED
ncbi:hypothetical protein ACIGXM_09945 [Kitasatospora sp. NPDC052896]